MLYLVEASGAEVHSRVRSIFWDMHVDDSLAGGAGLILVQLSCP